MKEVHGWAYPEADEFMAAEMRPDGSYQSAQLTAALSYVTDWSCAVDGGAHVGTWSRVLSGRFQRVIAVEPSPDTYEALVANLVAFGCENVEAKAVALGCELGHVRMAIDARHEALANTGARYVLPGGPIPVETIDAWALPSLGLLKLDIEGAEASAIRGAMQTIQRSRPVVIYENKGFGSRYGELPSAAADLLGACGYVLAERVSRDEIWRPR